MNLPTAEIAETILRKLLFVFPIINVDNAEENLGDSSRPVSEMLSLPDIQILADTSSPQRKSFISPSSTGKSPLKLTKRVSLMTIQHRRAEPRQISQSLKFIDSDSIASSQTTDWAGSSPSFMRTSPRGSSSTLDIGQNEDSRTKFLASRPTSPAILYQSKKSLGNLEVEKSKSEGSENSQAESYGFGSDQMMEIDLSVTVPGTPSYHDNVDTTIAAKQLFGDINLLLDSLVTELSG